MRVFKRFLSTVSALLLSFPFLISPAVALAQGELIVCGPNQDLKCTLSDKECSSQSDCVSNSNLPDALGGSACQNGYCYFDPIRMNEYQRSTTTVFGVGVQNEIVELKKPALEINIPGLNFSDAKQTLDKDGYIHVPYVGEFLSALYNYALVIGSILAVLMIIKSGVTIILSAGGEGKMEGYHQIGQVVIGLMIMWGSYFVLNTINPKLTKFQALRVKYIEPVEYVLDGESDDALDENAAPPSRPTTVAGVPTGTVSTSTLNAQGVYCPSTGGASEVKAIVESMKEKVAYRWGGKGGAAPYPEKDAKYEAFKSFCPENNICLDCSGFVNYVYKCAGIASPGGGTSAMSSNADPIDPANTDYSTETVNGAKLASGDLLGWVGHVIMYIGDGFIAESYGGLSGRAPNANPRIVKLDSLSKKSYHDKFTFIKKATP